MKINKEMHAFIREIHKTTHGIERIAYTLEILKDILDIEQDKQTKQAAYLRFQDLLILIMNAQSDLRALRGPQ